MQLTIQSENDGVVEALLSGRITQKEIAAMEDPFVEHLNDGAYARRVLLDLKDCEFIDSSGISWLLASHRRFKEAGGKLVIYNTTPTVMNVLKVLRMHMVLNVAETKSEAKEKLG